MRVYVGNLPSTAEKSEVEREFKRYGSVRDVWVARNPPGFAFIEFDDPRDAEVCQTDTLLSESMLFLALSVSTSLFASDCVSRRMQSARWTGRRSVVAASASKSLAEVAVVVAAVALADRALVLLVVGLELNLLDLNECMSICTDLILISDAIGVKSSPS